MQAVIANARRQRVLVPLLGAVLMVAAASLAGCMVGPDFKAPEPPPTNRYLPDEGATLNLVSAGIPGGEAQRVVQDLDIPSQWWTVFQSQPLNGLIARSLKANPDIKSAVAALKVSQQTARAQRATLFPTVGVAGTAAQTQAPTVLSAPTADPNNYVFGLFTALINIPYSLDVWGGTRRGIESAEAQAEAQCFLLEAAYLTLASNVVVAAITEAERAPPSISAISPKQSPARRKPTSTWLPNGSLRTTRTVPSSRT